ncbi:PREDICTED: uncharacterized protein LOC109473192 [Branchiostoma belcheri]|uniref:Uncharacterized protein LOC109473192 n=1 Tax=Branchiostoma belcheri TaxID=7741 RepID=A0A6P4ZC10_BRABE|nr:PREDICTED: uncharacterized protein LOC109473192 [Branchiostoma belcheri]
MIRQLRYVLGTRVNSDFLCLLPRSSACVYISPFNICHYYHESEKKFYFNDMRDKRGVFRGACLSCTECEDFETDDGKTSCGYCGCPPASHTRQACASASTPEDAPSSDANNLFHKVGNPYLFHQIIEETHVGALPVVRDNPLVKRGLIQEVREEAGPRERDAADVRNEGRMSEERQRKLGLTPHATSGKTKYANSILPNFYHKYYPVCLDDSLFYKHFFVERNRQFGIKTKVENTTRCFTNISSSRETGSLG